MRLRDEQLLHGVAKRGDAVLHCAGGMDLSRVRIRIGEMLAEACRIKKAAAEHNRTTLIDLFVD